MKHILVPGQVWHGRPVRALPVGNRWPVALSDTLTLLQDSPPTSVIVLDNDFDPEGGALVVLSATAVLGDVVINGDDTLSYTPPLGYVGPDTVTYTVADDQGQVRAANVVISVSAPELSIDPWTLATLAVSSENGSLSMTVVEPFSMAGTYAIETSDLSGGPVNLVSPEIIGAPEVGEVLYAIEGLWIFDTVAGTPTRSWQWLRNGAPIAGATSSAYTVTGPDVGASVSVTETFSDSNGARNKTSSTVGALFNPSDDTALLGWWDASDSSTLTENSGSVSIWADKAGSAALTQSFAPQMPETDVRTIGGLNALNFDGGRLMVATRSLPASGDVAFHMALEIDSVSNLYEAILAVEATNDFQIDAASSLAFDGRLNAAGIGSPVDLSGGPFSGPIILSAIFDLTGAGQAEVFISDVSRGVTPYTTAIDASVALHLMTNRTVNAWATGAVGELIISGDVSNRATYHAYLANKWGIA